MLSRRPAGSDGRLNRMAKESQGNPCWQQDMIMILLKIMILIFHGTAANAYYTLIQQSFCKSFLGSFSFLCIWVNREKWRETVRDIRAGGATWWWWWHAYIHKYTCMCMYIFHNIYIYIFGGVSFSFSFFLRLTLSIYICVRGKRQRERERQTDRERDRDSETERE